MSVRTKHRHHSDEREEKRCTSHLDLDYQVEPCCTPCEKRPSIPCTGEMEYPQGCNPETDKTYMCRHYGQYSFLSSMAVEDLVMPTIADLPGKTAPKLEECHVGTHKENTKYYAYNLCTCITCIPHTYADPPTCTSSNSCETYENTDYLTAEAKYDYSRHVVNVICSASSASTVKAPCDTQTHEPAPTEDCVRGDFDTDLNFAESHTVNLRVVMPTALQAVAPGKRQWLFAAGDGSNAEHWLWHPHDQHGKVQFGEWNGKQVHGLDGILDASSLTAVYDADLKTYKLYMNGKEASSLDDVTFDHSNGQLSIGKAVGNWVGRDIPFVGCIKRVEVFDRPLTPDEVKAVDTGLPQVCENEDHEENL